MLVHVLVPVSYAGHGNNVFVFVVMSLQIVYSPHQILYKQKTSAKTAWNEDYTEQVQICVNNSVSNCVGWLALPGDYKRNSSMHTTLGVRAN